MSRSSDRSKEVKYVYDLPYMEMKLLCNILDSNNDWEKLGGIYMSLKWCELEEYRRAERCGESPTNRLLQAWGQQNHTVNELFVLLWRMEHFQAMRALKSCVSEKYHKLFTDAERRTTGIFCEKSPPVGGVVVRDPQESKRIIRSNSNNAVAHHIPETSRSNHNNSILETSPRVIQNGSVLEASARPTNSTKQQTLPVHTRQRPQSENDDADVMTEGACALASPSYNYNSHNFNHGASDSHSHPLSPKVPVTFLYPTATTHSTVNARPSMANQQQHRLVTNLASALGINKKVNTKINGTFSEVSCEDNNAEELKTVCKASRYDPEKDYLEKLREKGEKEAAHAACGNEATRSTNTSGGVSFTVTEPPVPVSPLRNPQGHILEYPGAERQRKVSNASDSSSHSTSVPMIPYKELEEATALWSPDHLLGRGGFGTVYKGNWKNTEVAIKRIEPHGNASLDNNRLHITQSLEELKLLQSYRHDNILQVYGYSTDHELFPCLVYQFMPNGSLEDRLQLRKIEAFGEGPPLGAATPLTWLQRFRIAWGTAQTLQFLHTVKEKPLIHGDVKSANILLDQNYEPKLGDFGLAREGKSQSTSMKVSRVHGTKPYLPSDYLRSKKLSVKVDTYSYGIVLFEMCTGLRAYDEKRREGGKFLKELVDDTSDEELLRDKNVGFGPDDQVFTFLFKLGKDCVKRAASQRPDMTTVFAELESYGLVLKERAQARKISQGETASVVSSPHLLQVCYDTAKSLQSPSLSPTTQPSLPHFIHVSPSPSAASMHPAYQSPPSPSIIPPRSPVPPILPPNSPVPLHYSQRPVLHPDIPGLVANGPYAYHPRRLHYGGAPSWKQGAGGNILYGMGPPYPVGPQFHSPQMSRDPPSYSETISQGPAGALGGIGGVSPVIPELSGLCINDGQSKVSSNDSESSQSDLGYSESSLIASTTQNVSTVNGAPIFPQRTVTDNRFPTVIPTGLSQHQEISRESAAASVVPLLTALGINSVSDLPSSVLSNPHKQPSAANKKLSLFG